MLFIKQNKKRHGLLLFAMLPCLISFTTAFAINHFPTVQTYNTKEVVAIIAQSNLDGRLNITAEPEVILELNRIHHSNKAREEIRDSLKRMRKYQSIISHALAEKMLPQDLAAMPLIQSGYQSLNAQQNPVRAAGIWQIIPSTGKNLGLVINEQQDQRMDTRLATQAVVHLLSTLYTQFQDWKLAVLAYGYGDNLVASLIKTTGSKEAWQIARSTSAPKDMSRYLAKFDAVVIILHNPSLVRGRT